MVQMPRLFFKSFLQLYSAAENRYNDKKRKGGMGMKLRAMRLERPLTATEEARLRQLVPPARLARLARVKDPLRRREPLCVWALLRQMLREEWGWTAWPEIVSGPQGKPLFADRDHACFNLSHTDGAVLAAISAHPVGVDIQRIRPLSAQSLRRLAPGMATEDFFPCWVRREARAKLDGVHMNGLLRRETPLRPGERYDAVETFPGYAAGAASWSGEAPGSVRTVTLAELLEQSKT